MRVLDIKRQMQPDDIAVVRDLIRDAERGLRVGMDFRPTETSHAVIDFVNTKPIGIEPRLSETRGESCGIPTTLFGVVREGSVVHRQPVVLVLPLHEGPSGDLAPCIGGRQRQ